MANEKRDKHYAQRAMNRCLIHIGVLMVVGLGIVTQIEEGPRHFSTFGWILIWIWLALLVAGIVWVTAVKRGYRCPKCGTPLPMMRREASSGYEERFHCDHCHVTWTTGVFPGDG